MLTLMLLQDLFLLCFCISMYKSNEIRLLEAIKNADFQTKRITELPIITRKVRSKLECVIKCQNLPSCLSFTFNDESKECFLYDQDFVNVTETQTTDETGWNYYYVISGNVLHQSECELPTTGICRSFCFFYRNGFSSNTTQDYIQACDVKGGEVIKVDRYLKQYCMAQAVDPVIIGNAVTVLNGILDEATKEWTHFDGTKPTYYFWDVTMKQPNFGANEFFIGMSKRYKYMWHDYSNRAIKGVLCEIN